MNETRVKLNQATWHPVAAFACFAGSVLSLALGFAFTTNWLLDAVRHPVLHVVGITLLIIGIPILILGGHCLDLMDKKKKKSKRVLHLGGANNPEELNSLGTAAPSLRLRAIPLRRGLTTRKATDPDRN